MIEIEDDGCPKPGIFPKVPQGEYSSWKAASYSTVSPYFRSAAHGHYEETHPSESSSAQSLGIAAHAAILEPERFDSIVKRPASLDGAGRGKVAQQARANWEREHVGQEWVTEDEHDYAIAMRDAVYSHSTAAEILKSPGLREVSLVWVDFEYGVKCKAKLDILALWNGYRIIGDLKSCRDARPRAAASSMHKYDYHRQCAWYLSGAAALDPQDRNFVQIAVENDPPFGVAVYQIDGSDIQQGHDEMRLALDRYVKGHKTGKFPAYDSGMGILTLPGYAKRFHGEEA
jgi:hypothetical protein